MTSQESQVDLERIKQAFVEILLRRRAEADDPVESVAALFADPPEAGPVADGGYSDKWREFLDMYGDQWDGTAKGWTEYRQWIELYAAKFDLSDEARLFLDAAEAEGDAAARIKFFARHGVEVSGERTAGDRADPLATRPSRDADDREVDVYLSETKGSDGAGDHYWVKIGDEFGKLYVKGHKFVVEPDAVIRQAIGIEPRGLPVHDAAGRKIEEFRSAKAGEDHVVRIGELWGRLDDKGGFVALYPDDSAYPDWSTRTVTGDGYRHNGVDYSGRWYRPWPDQDVYLLERQGGIREWAKGHQLTAAGKGHSIAQVLAGIAKPYDDRL